MTPASRIVCRCSVKDANAASEEWSWWRVAVRRYVATLFPMLPSSFKSSRFCGLRSLCLCVMMLLIIWVCHGHHVQTNTESEILFLSAIEFWFHYGKSMGFVASKIAMWAMNPAAKSPPPGIAPCWCQMIALWPNLWSHQPPKSQFGVAPQTGDTVKQPKKNPFGKRCVAPVNANMFVWCIRSMLFKHVCTA